MKKNNFYFMKMFKKFNFKSLFFGFCIALSITMPYIIENLLLSTRIISYFNIDVYFWLVFIFLFASMHIVISPIQIWNFIYKKRWFICIALLIIIAGRGYNISSINMYDSYVQPNITSKSYSPVLNQPLSIRSDEWAGTTPLKLSQLGLSNKLSSKSNILMASDNNFVNFYPVLPSFSVSMISMPRLWGYLFNQKIGVSFDSMSELVLLLFVSFDLLMILTKKNKYYSLFGALIIALSPANIWWNGYCYLLYGEAIVVATYLFATTDRKNVKKKILLSLLIGWLISCDIMVMYPAWLIPYTYIFTILVVWILVKNLKKEDFFQTLLYIMLAFAMASFLVLPGYICSKDIFEITNNTVYPGKRFGVGGDLIDHVGDYIMSIFLFIKPSNNVSETSQFISFYPIPILLSCYVLLSAVLLNIKDKVKKIFSKVDILQVSLILLAVVFILYENYNLPFLSKITLLSYSTEKRMSVVINYLCLLILLRTISTYNFDKSFKLKKIFIPLLVSIIYVLFKIIPYIDSYPLYYDLSIKIFTILFFAIFIFLMLMNNKIANKLFITLLGVYTLISAILVIPVSVGVDVIYNKPVSKKVHELVHNNPDSIWISANNSFVVGNYIAANGARTINTTNYYPNIKMWKKFENFSQYENAYNRFAYFQIDFTNEETWLELVQQDLIILHLNLNDLDILNVNYILSGAEINDVTNKFDFELLYYDDGQYIYNVYNQLS